MKDALRRALTWALAVALVLAIAGTVHLAIDPPETTPAYTEFYLLGPDGNASGYPTNLSVGEEGTVIVGIVNHEHERVTYALVLELDGAVIEERRVTVDDEATWEEPVTFSVEEPGRQRLRFLLYRGEVEGEPYRHLRLWVEVRG